MRDSLSLCRRRSYLLLTLSLSHKFVSYGTVHWRLVTCCAVIWIYFFFPPAIPFFWSKFDCVTSLSDYWGFWVDKARGMLTDVTPLPEHPHRRELWTQKLTEPVLGSDANSSLLHPSNAKFLLRNAKIRSVWQWTQGDSPIFLIRSWLDIGNNDEPWLTLIQVRRSVHFFKESPRDMKSTTLGRVERRLALRAQSLPPLYG